MFSYTFECMLEMATYKPIIDDKNILSLKKNTAGIHTGLDAAV